MPWKFAPKKIKGVDLARAVGVKPPSVSDWLSGKSKTMEGENLLKASKFLGVNPNWLATGNGSPTNNNIEDDQLSNVIFRDLNLHKILFLTLCKQVSGMKSFMTVLLLIVIPIQII